MKIRCRECKTIYDNSEKYCPYCFSRTNPHDCYHLNVDGEIVGKTRTKKTSQSVKTNQTNKTNQAYKTSQVKNRNRNTNVKKKSAPGVVFAIVMILFYIIFVMMMFSFD